MNILQCTVSEFYTVNYVTHDPLRASHVVELENRGRDILIDIYDFSRQLLVRFVFFFTISTFYFLLLLQEVRRCCPSGENLIWPWFNALWGKKHDEEMRKNDGKKCREREQLYESCQSVPRGRCCWHTCIQCLVVAMRRKPGNPFSFFVKRC